MIKEESDYQVGVPFDDEGEVEEIGWIQIEWKNKYKPLPENPKLMTHHDHAPMTHHDHAPMTHHDHAPMTHHDDNSWRDENNSWDDGVGPTDNDGLGPSDQLPLRDQVPHFDTDRRTNGQSQLETDRYDSPQHEMRSRYGFDTHSYDSRDHYGQERRYEERRQSSQERGGYDSPNRTFENRTSPPRMEHRYDPKDEMDHYGFDIKYDPDQSTNYQSRDHHDHHDMDRDNRNDHEIHEKREKNSGFSPPHGEAWRPDYSSDYKTDNDDNRVRHFWLSGWLIGY